MTLTCVVRLVGEGRVGGAAEEDSDDDSDKGRVLTQTVGRDRQLSRALQVTRPDCESVHSLDLIVEGLVQVQDPSRTVHSKRSLRIATCRVTHQWVSTVNNFN